MLTRRQFSICLLGTGAAIGTRGPLQQSCEVLPDLSSSADGHYDLLIQGGTVVDPARSVRHVLDVAVKDGKIAEISPNIAPEKSRKTISAAGKLVTPGLIDLHVHVYEGATEAGINADRFCIGHGVTTAVDAGSAGYPSIAGLRKYVINASQTRLYALLDIGALGTLVGIKDAMENLEWVNPELAAKAANANKPVVIGIKARLSKDVAGTNDIEGLRRARRAAEDSRLPMMVHIGDTDSPLRTILELLRPGDIVTHCYTPRPHGIVDENGKVLPEIRAARERGILFDVGHGTFHFGFDLTEKCLQQGFLPDSISSDLAGRSVNGPTFDLTTTLSKFLLLGMTVDNVLELATSKPARAFDFGLELGTLQPGGPADISILEVREGMFEFVDSLGTKRTGRQELFAAAAIRDGKLFEPTKDTQSDKVKSQ
jgi:dihydroorotase